MRGLRQGVVPELRHAFYDSDLSRIECNGVRRRSELRGCIVPLLLCGLLFAIGYNSEFMGPDRLFGAYMLMSVYGGWKFINRFCPFVFVWFSVEAIFWYFLIKVALSMLIGFFVTPVYLGYCIWRIWRLAF